VSSSLTLSTQASQRCFRSLLDALANPGKVVTMNEPEAVTARAAVVALTLADIDTPMAIVGDEVLAAEVSEATRAPLVPVSEARLVALLEPTLELVGQCQTGSAEAPELGAKVGLGCSRLLSLAGEARVPPAAGGVQLVLEGPGVAGTRRLFVEGIDPAVFDAVARANKEFPAGLDVWLISLDGNVAGLPRSTRVKVR
jgi:alpha-D-ribose 1-methylphosphonate 5-triphosphate synthase subunit PhnH